MLLFCFIPIRISGSRTIVWETEVYRNSDYNFELITLSWFRIYQTGALNNFVFKMKIKIRTLQYRINIRYIFSYSFIFQTFNQKQVCEILQYIVIVHALRVQRMFFFIVIHSIINLIIACFIWLKNYLS